MKRYDKSLPAKMQIGYREIFLNTVEYDPDFHNQMGQFDDYLDRITICITGRPKADANTLLHEIFHVIYDQYMLEEDKFGKKYRLSDMVRKGDKEKAEERVVNSFANGMCEVFVRNPKVAEWINSRLSDD